MVFSSPQFLFLYLPIVLALYFSVSVVLPRARNLFLLVASLLFYAYGERELVVILAGSAIGNYVLGRLLGRVSTRKGRRLVLILAVSANLGLLGLFKYSSFAVLSLNHILHFFICLPSSCRICACL